MMAGMGTGKKWMTALAATVLLICAAATLVLRSGYHEAKDQRDLSDLTRAWDRPLDELRVPNELPADRVTGEISASGMTLPFPSPDFLNYAVLLADERGDPAWGVSCDATAIVICRCAVAHPGSWQLPNG